MFCRVKVWRLWYIPTHTSSWTICVSKSSSTSTFSGAYECFDRGQCGGDGTFLLIYLQFSLENCSSRGGNITWRLVADDLRYGWQSVKHMAGVADKPMHAQSYGEPPTQKVLKKKNGVNNDPIVSKKVTIRFTVGKGGEKETQPKVIQNGLSFDHLSSASLGNDDKHNLSDAEFSPEPSPRSMIKVCTLNCTFID